MRQLSDNQRGSTQRGTPSAQWRILLLLSAVMVVATPTSASADSPSLTARAISMSDNERQLPLRQQPFQNTNSNRQNLAQTKIRQQQERQLFLAQEFNTITKQQSPPLRQKPSQNDRPVVTVSRPLMGDAPTSAPLAVPDDGSNTNPPTTTMEIEEIITESPSPVPAMPNTPQETSSEVTIPSAAPIKEESAMTPAPVQETEVSVSRDNRVQVTLNFLVASTSTSETDPQIDTNQLDAALTIFTTTLIQEWSYRRQLGFLNDPYHQSQNQRYLRGQRFVKGNNSQQQLAVSSSSSYKRIQQPRRQQQQHQHRHQRRRLDEVELIADSVAVNDNLQPSTDCIISADASSSTTTGDASYNHCNEAQGQFQVTVMSTDGNFDEKVFCKNMERSIDSLMRQDDYLQVALELSYGDNTNLQLQPGGMTDCAVVVEGQPTAAPVTLGPTTLPAAVTAPTLAPTAASSSFNDPFVGETESETTDDNPFENGNNNGNNNIDSSINTTSLSNSSETPIMSPPPAPVPALPPQSEESGSGTDSIGNWADLVAAVKEEEKQKEEEEEAAAAAAAEEANRNNSGSGRNYTEEMARTREELWDDSELDRVFMIMLCVWGGLLSLVCCCYWMDLARLVFWYDEEIYEEDQDGEVGYVHQGITYWDLELNYPKNAYRKTESGEFKPLTESQKRARAVAMAARENGEDSGFLTASSNRNLMNSFMNSHSEFVLDMSSSEEGDDDDEDYELGFVEESGNFYVESEDGDDEDDDDFDSDDESCEILNSEDEYFDDEESNAGIDGSDEDETSFEMSYSKDDREAAPIK